jgi:3-oxoacyl-[acyl-carrier protein] reductase
VSEQIRGVALVTGGGRGIGAAIARALASKGMRVAVASRSPGEIGAVAADVDGMPIVADVADEAQVNEAVERVEAKLGPISLLVCNAGIGGDEQVTWETDPTSWWRVFEVNVLGVFLCCRAVLPRMIARGGGRIIATGSAVSYLPVRSAHELRLGTAYPATKAALGRFIELLAIEAAPHNVRVFLISPGLIRTNLTTSFPDDAPWTPVELTPRLVCALASGKGDALAGRYLHAANDDIERLISETPRILAEDLNAIRLRT